MKPDDKKKSKDTSSWGVFFSIALHVTVLVLVLFWGFSGTSKNDSMGPIEVSLSNLPPGGGQGSGEPARPRRVEPPPPPPPAPEPPEAREEVVKEPPPPEPEKVEVKKEEQEPVPEEKVVKKEPEPEPEPEKKVIPIEPEKKEPEKKVVKKPEPTPEPKKEVKKEVAKKPEPTDKPKAPEKKTSKNLESEKSKVLQDIKRQRVLENLKKGSPEESEQPAEPMGEEQRLAMADSGSESEDAFGDSPPEGPGTASERPGGGNGGVNTALLGIYTNQVHQRIKRNWRIPPGVPTDGDLSTGVFFRVDSGGRVLDVRVNKSSGNSAFDQYCVDAIRKASPLPPPPAEFAKAAEREGMDITFYNETF